MEYCMGVDSVADPLDAQWERSAFGMQYYRAGRLERVLTWLLLVILAPICLAVVAVQFYK